MSLHREQAWAYDNLKIARRCVLHFKCKLSQHTFSLASKQHGSYVSGQTDRQTYCFSFVHKYLDRQASSRQTNRSTDRWEIGTQIKWNLEICNNYTMKWQSRTTHGTINGLHLINSPASTKLLTTFACIFIKGCVNFDCE